MSDSIGLFRNILSQAENEKVTLKGKVDQLQVSCSGIHHLQVEISKIEKELQAPHKHFPPQPLLALLDQLSTYRSELDCKVAELTAEFKRLKLSEEDLCHLLHIPPLDGFPLIPSPNDKLRVQRRINELEDLKVCAVHLS